LRGFLAGGLGFEPAPHSSFFLQFKQFGSGLQVFPESLRTAHTFFRVSKRGRGAHGGNEPVRPLVRI